MTQSTSTILTPLQELQPCQMSADISPDIFTYRMSYVTADTDKTTLYIASDRSDTDKMTYSIYTDITDKTDQTISVCLAVSKTI